MITRVTFLTIFLFCASHSFSQLGNIPFVFGQATQVGREIRRTSEAHKAQELAKEQEEKYFLTISEADACFDKADYAKAIDLYTQALAIKENEAYPTNKIAEARALAEQANIKAYQGFLTKGDSLYEQMKFTDAIKAYSSALEKIDSDYPRAQIELCKTEMEYWTKVHFSGLLISDAEADSVSSRAFSNDVFSDFIKPGTYSSIEKSLIYSKVYSLDGIAVPAKMRLVIYSKPDLQGEVLLDVTGPAIINNVKQKGSKSAQVIQTKDFIPQLQDDFPQSVRRYSNGNMNLWTTGSMEIITL